MDPKGLRHKRRIPDSGSNRLNKARNTAAEKFAVVQNAIFVPGTFRCSIRLLRFGASTSAFVNLRGAKQVDVRVAKGEKGTAAAHRHAQPQIGRGCVQEAFSIAISGRQFHGASSELDKIAQAAWDAYAHSRKSPRTRKAGPQFADPEYELAEDWIAAHEAIEAARRRHENKQLPPRILLINCSSRSEHTCPGEMSKSYRLLRIASDLFAAAAVETEILDLSRLASEYGRNIHPCKACFSTSPALCHWPCSCYPNYSLGQTQDWMNEIYPMWVAAHGIMIVTPVNWYQVSSPLKLMMDRMVCADGGNADPTRTHGKDALRAKELELAGWDYQRHLAGRLFSVVVHGDVEGAADVRRAISDWLCFMHLCPAGPAAELDRYIGYWQPYATSHDELDRDDAVQEEVQNAARSLLEGVQATRSGKLVVSGENLTPPRQK